MIIETLKPYWYLARWHRPVGSLLLMFPCWWGIAYFPLQETSFQLLVLCALGSFIMRGAGCALNDWFDQDIDRHVERTKTRPISAGQLTPEQVFGFITVQLILGACVLWLIPYRAWSFAFLGAAFMVIYPLAKRMTNYPQFVLGLTFNIGVWVGATAMLPEYGNEILPLSFVYIAGICWTLGYDTIYALQDKEDDILIGVGSTTIAFGEYVKPVIAGVYVLSYLFLTMAGILSQRSMIYYGILTIFYGFIEWRLLSLDLSNRSACDSFFKINIWLGMSVFCALALSKF